ncbi:hypothetical protein F4808DRAFT_291859 [Astrocystis sublimbata]|nr:hypothetical protein F4808DRAFT_291859 [Astrocystis sublimbata]
MAPDVRKEVDDASRWSPTESETTDTNNTSNRSKGGIRVSVACVQCRSKHVKCDATQPACARCIGEGKPCYYAKSRRGIRDAKKRSLISDMPPVPSTHHVNEAIKSAAIALFSIPKNLSGGWTSSSSSFTNDSLVGAFFDHFHLSHPILPPKRIFLKYIGTDPSPYHFLLSVINFCGAKYAGHARLNDLRETAYSAACGPLPFTVHSVQGLNIMAIIAFGESKFTHHVGFANRSRELAVELGMHRRTFAARISDPVWAESCRRTWWFLKSKSVIPRINEAELAVDTFDVESDTDIPCSEEWEYQTGDIPLSMSLRQYERDINLGHSDFSSLAFQIEMSRIETGLEFLNNDDDAEDEKRPELINQADLRICDFLRRIPQWKMDVVDPDGKPDQVLFSAMASAHILRIRLRQSSFRNGLNIREYFPLGPDRGPDRKGQAVKRYGWNPHSIDIQAANSVCHLFRVPFPVKSLRPTLAPGLLRVAIVYLDACVFLGLDSLAFRERLNAIIQILKLHGETWPLSKTIAEDIQAVADEYLGPIPKDQSPNANSSIYTNGWDAMLSADTLMSSSMSSSSSTSAPFLEASTVGFDPCSFLDAQMQAMPLDMDYGHHHHQPDHHVLSTFLPQGLVPAIPGL